MTIHRHPNFKKAYKNRVANDQKLIVKIKKRIEYFVNNPSHPLLRDHALTGTKKGLRAFSVTGDIRIVYRWIESHTIELLTIGTHNQVYN
ncbi:MAG: type II toxin-antitoxin system mRNA interferase toxin, RelE/StbE family [bacterium]|nr:type II toxin-antitoxin system mRNA interferase toxin, RelE/StbE family [bacterium]